MGLPKRERAHRGKGLGGLGANIISEWTERLVELGSRWMTGLVRGKEPKRAQLG
jgi:hypothetical protein